MTSKHRESDTTVHRRPITKQGSALVRWAAVEAAQAARSAGWLCERRTAIAERRGHNIATVAIARRLLTLVYYGLHGTVLGGLDRDLVPVAWLTASELAPGRYHAYVEGHPL